MKTGEIEYPVVFSSKLQDVINTLVIHPIKPHATTHHKIKILAYIAMLKRKLFFKKQVRMKFGTYQLSSAGFSGMSLLK